MASEPTAQICPGCGTTVDTTEVEPLVRIACPTCGKKIRVERTFDHFVVVETLGVGGMGTVYKARDTQLDRFVALKLLRRDLGGEEDHKARLQQEARIAAAVNHPCVIQVFDSGTDHAQFYVVMELVDHGSLDDLMALQPRLPEARVLEIGIQVARGLRAAHRRGLIHRDVKPANILFVDEHAAKIGDFGLASTATQRWGTGGVVWGTPEYVSPERLSNDPEDFRSDIYSLGATLFHAIAGKPPIAASTNSATALLESKQRPLNLQATAPDVSAATVEVLQRMIAADPAQRFSSYDDLVVELERAWRALALEDPTRGGETRRRHWSSALSGFTRRSLEGLRGVLRWLRGLPLLIRLALPALVAAAILFVIARGFLPSWTELTAFATSWFDRSPWNKALASYREQVALYHFAQAAEEIRNVKLIGGYYKPAEEVAEKRAQLMFDWKNNLIDDLNRAHFSGTLTDSSGAQYTGIVSATDEGLTMKLPYGIAWITWDKLSPTEILAVSKSFIDPGARGAADRQWRCAVFASETGQTEAARELAEAAARAKPEYKEQISGLFPGMSQAP
ncbi:MAG TPA: serine/threonine-protein kinase [Candidatus Udaeobacter sp.]|nr:serine/threonine-protein kinase [Candidatus Udaeobacter sp.]